MIRAKIYQEYGQYYITYKKWGLWCTLTDYNVLGRYRFTRYFKTEEEAIEALKKHLTPAPKPKFIREMKLLILIILLSGCTQKVLCPTYDSQPSKTGSGYFKPKSI